MSIASRIDPSIAKTKEGKATLEEYYQACRDQLNELLKELQDSPVEFKHGYSVCVGGILNGYREGDITFRDACKRLRMAGTLELDADELQKFVLKVQDEASKLTRSQV